MKNKFFLIVFLLLVAVILFQYITRPDPPDYTEYIKIGGKEYILLSKTRDTFWRDSIILVPKYIPGVDNIIEVEVPAEVDTNAILKDYYSKVFYRDSIPIDSIGYAIISDTLHRNRIHSRVPYFSYRIPTFIETIVVKDKPKHKFYIGGGLNFNGTEFLSNAYGSVLWLTKKDKIFTLNLGATNMGDQVHPYYGGSIYWRIKRK